MKKRLIVPFCLFLYGGVQAQSVQEAKELIYHERYSSAAQTLQAVLQTNAADASAWYWQSQAYLQQNKADSIKNLLLTAPAQAQNEPLYQVAYGHVLLQEGKKDSAQLLFDKALKETREKNAEVLAAVAKAHIDAPSGDVNYALAQLEKAIKREKKDPTLYTLKGEAYRRLLNGSEAFKAYQEALDKDKNYAAALYKLGNIFASQKNTELYLKYYNDALAADPNFGPANYALYLHYYYTDAARAMDYFKKFAAQSDKSRQHDYWYTDLLYLNKQYDMAIQNATHLIQKEGEKAEPRLYKLVAYSYKDQGDNAQAFNYMNAYFDKAPDSVHVMKDYETMGELYAATEGKADSAAAFYEKAVALVEDSAARYNYYKKLAGMYGKMDNSAAQAQWLGKFYEGNSKATNVDLFNWGLAHFKAAEYELADSVFGRYTTQYPEQTFGYYWRARSNTARDSAMEKGYAVPHYQKLIAVAQNDTSASETNKKWMIEAYGYLAAYETNTNKDYAAAIRYFEQLLVLDPENADAQRYMGILKKNMNSGAGANSETTKAGK